MKLIIFGSPGCGKGTQSYRLEQKFKIKHISTGDLLRKEKTVQDIIKSGDFVTDELIYQLILEYLTDSFILDGFPRNRHQCEMLGDISAAIYVKIDSQLCVERLLARNEGREDDNLETIKKRMVIYQREIEKIVDYYEKRGKLVLVNGDGTVDEVFERILKGLRELNI